MREEAARAEVTPEVFPGANFRIALPSFEGPLDLLLHLIREHKLDIFDIPVALITEKYLACLESMREINLDIAGEFLVMASTLAHIKSRLLLPKDEVAQDAEPEEAGDPRAELVRRLLEYQKYKEAAETLARQDILGKDVFTRKVHAERVQSPEDELGLAEISIYKLIDALDRVLKRLGQHIQKDIFRERLSISDAIHRVVDRLRAEGRLSFFALFEGQVSRNQVIVTFLAILEMCKLRLIRIYQETEDDILISAKGEALHSLSTTEVDEREYK